MSQSALFALAISERKVILYKVQCQNIIHPKGIVLRMFLVLNRFLYDAEPHI